MLSGKLERNTIRFITKLQTHPYSLVHSKPDNTECIDATLCNTLDKFSSDINARIKDDICNCWLLCVCQTSHIPADRERSEGQKSRRKPQTAAVRRPGAHSNTHLIFQMLPVYNMNNKALQCCTTLKINVCERIIGMIICLIYEGVWGFEHSILIKSCWLICGCEDSHSHSENILGRPARVLR